MIPAKEEFREAFCRLHGEETAKKLAEARVAVCGLGGLGSNIAISLARAGVGKLNLIDFDKVSISNLNRQQYAVKHIGMYKTEALREILGEIAPLTETEIHTVKITDENAGELLRNDKIIVEAFDNADCKAMLVNIVMERFPDKYIVAASGMAGLGSANDVLTRKITDRFYICGDGKSDVEKEKTLFSSRAMLCAAHQANAVLRIISGKI